jgi:hypothetical protein
MTKRAGFILVGAIGAGLAAAAAVHFGRSEPEAPAERTQRAAVRPNVADSEHGWIAQPGTSAGAHTGGAVDPSHRGANVAAAGGTDVRANDRPGQLTGARAMGTYDTMHRGAAAAGPRDPDAIPVDPPPAVAAPAVGAAHQSGLTDEASGDGQGTSNGAPPPATPQGQEVTRSSEQAPVYDSGAEARFSTAAQFEVPDGGKVTPASGTVSVWLQPGWTDGNQDDASLVELGDHGLHIFKNVDFLRFEFTDSDGAAHGTGTNIDAWKGGEWHNVTATWGDGVISFYVDGQVVAERVAAQLDLPSGSKLLIGSDYPPGRPVAPGALGNIQVYDRPSTPAEVTARLAQSSLATR